MCVEPRPWMHRYATLSLAPLTLAFTISHCTGQGLSTPSSVCAVLASDTVMPSCTSAAAARRLAGVMRLRAPISSSGPHRPQFERSSSQRSYSASVISGRTSWALAAGTTPESNSNNAAPVPAMLVRIRRREIFMWSPRRLSGHPASDRVKMRSGAWNGQGGLNTISPGLGIAQMLLYQFTSPAPPYSGRFQCQTRP